MADETSSLDVEPRWIIASLLVGLGLAGVAGSIVRARVEDEGAEEGDAPGQSASKTSPSDSIM